MSNVGAVEISQPLLLLVPGHVKQSFNLGIILSSLFSGNSSHSDCLSSNTCLFTRDFKSEKGMSSPEMSPSRSSLAAESAAEFPLTPTWPGTQKKTISFPALAVLQFPPTTAQPVAVKNSLLFTVLSLPVSGKEHGENISAFHTATVLPGPVSVKEHGENTSALHTATVLSGPVSGKEHGGKGSSLDTVPVLQSVIIFCLLHIHRIFRLRSSALL